jgi:hypothetical protein
VSLGPDGLAGLSGQASASQGMDTRPVAGSPAGSGFGPVTVGLPGDGLGADLAALGPRAGRGRARAWVRAQFGPHGAIVMPGSSAPDTESAPLSQPVLDQLAQPDGSGPMRRRFIRRRSSRMDSFGPHADAAAEAASRRQADAPDGLPPRLDQPVADEPMLDELGSPGGVLDQMAGPGTGGSPRRQWWRRRSGQADRFGPHADAGVGAGAEGADRLWPAAPGELPPDGQPGR